jgi:glycosyltransferase involved in cell wall biosynthesis
VLLPAHDAAATLGPCLASLARQTLADWECVLADDGSTDGTLERARSLCAGDPRFRALCLPHRGIVATLNDGLRLCRGNYVARMDADDLMHRRRLAEQLELLEANPEWAAVGCHVRLFPRASLRDGARSYERWLNGIDSPARVRAEAFVECPVAHPTLMLRRTTLARLGYRDQGWPEDYDLVLRLLGEGATIGVLPRRRLCWRDHPGRLWRSSPVYRPERFAACKAAFLAQSFLAGHEGYILWGYGPTARALRRALLVQGRRPAQVVELHPRRLGQRIHGAPVIAPEALPRVARLPLVVAVAGAGPRARIREALASMGFRETLDFVCAA